MKKEKEKQVSKPQPATSRAMIGSEPFTELLDITPTMAMDWLAAVPEYQRKIDMNQVNKLIMAIQRKEWRVNGAAIVFNEKGDLIDGQHRLTAIFKSGQTVQSFVTTGVSKDDMTFASLGDTKPRRTADFIHTKNANVVAAVLRMIWLVENKLLYPSLKMKQKSATDGTYMTVNPPVAELVKLAKKHAEEIETLVEPLRAAMKITKGGSWVPFLMYYFHLYRTKTEATKVAEFFARIGDGVGLEHGSPVLLLRKRMLDPQAGLMELPRRVREALILKALNFYISDEKVDRLTWSPDKEPFPVLRGYDRGK